VFPEEVVVESQMSQHDRDATLQGEASIRISSLGKLSVQISQGVEMGTEFGDENSRSLKPERLMLERSFEEARIESKEHRRSPDHWRAHLEQMGVSALRKCKP